MEEFTAKFADQIAGTLSGFDRLVFRGTLRKIAYPFGLEGYLWANQVPMTGFGAHVNPTLPLTETQNQPNCSVNGRRLLTASDCRENISHQRLGFLFEEG